MSKTIIMFVVGLFVATSSHAEEEVNWVGTPSIAFRSDNAFVNFGGPSVKIESKTYFGGLSFFPSLRYSSTVKEWSPILGYGLYLGRKHLFVALPTYYYNSTWQLALGIGYKF